MSHTCHAHFCYTPCRPEHLMCARHWAMVPGSTKASVCSHYRHGQCRDGKPSQEWFDAAHLAIAHVAKQEGRPMSKRQRELLGAA